MKGQTLSVKSWLDRLDTRLKVAMSYVRYRNGFSSSSGIKTFYRFYWIQYRLINCSFKRYRYIKYWRSFMLKALKKTDHKVQHAMRGYWVNFNRHYNGLRKINIKVQSSVVKVVKKITIVQKSVTRIITSVTSSVTVMKKSMTVKYYKGSKKIVGQAYH